MQVSKRKLRAEIKRLRSHEATTVIQSPITSGYIGALENVLSGEFGMDKRVSKASKDLIHLQKTNLSLFGDAHV